MAAQLLCLKVVPLDTPFGGDIDTLDDERYGNVSDAAPIST